MQDSRIPSAGKFQEASQEIVRHKLSRGLPSCVCWSSLCHKLTRKYKTDAATALAIPLSGSAEVDQLNRASKMRKDCFRFSSNSRIAATFPHLHDFKTKVAAPLNFALRPAPVAVVRRRPDSHKSLSQESNVSTAEVAITDSIRASLNIHL